MNTINTYAELLTLPEVARLLKISRRTLERLISSRKFPHPFKIGRASRFSRDDVMGYLERLLSDRENLGKKPTGYAGVTRREPPRNGAEKFDQ